MSSGREKIAFVIAHLGPGGAQRVVAVAANGFAEHGFEVHVITLNGGPPDAHALTASVNRHTLTGEAVDDSKSGLGLPVVSPAQNGMEKALRGLILAVKPPLRLAYGLLMMSWLAWRLRKKLRAIGPDVVLSFLTQTNVITLMATRRAELPTIVSERNDPTLQRQLVEVDFLRRRIYRRAALVTANSFGALSAMKGYVPPSRLAYLPNPVTIPPIGQAITFHAPTFISVTRLVEQKGVDLLLRASATAFDELPSWRLAILGDGPQRDDLLLLARELKIAERIDWLGHVEDPFPYIRAAEFFVLTSRFEGSPNALLEAMSCGLPAVVSDASPGPLELIGNEAAGLIVPVGNVSATARAIMRLAKDKRLRERLGRAAAVRARQHRSEAALPIWLSLVQQTLNRASAA